MTELNFFRVKIILEAPLLVGFTAPDHNLYKTLDYIPSITLRGGIATELLPKLCQIEDTSELWGHCEICVKKEECQFYQFFYQNVFTLSNGLFLKDENNEGDEKECQNPDLVPTHPLIKQCKRCESDKKYVNYLKEWLIEEEPYIRATCQNPVCKRKTTMDLVGGNYCKSCNYMKKNPEIGLTTSTSINYAKNSSLTGYLFNYSYIQRGSIFESYLVFERNDPVLNNLNNINFLRLGRAKSRGFGKVRIDLKPLDIHEKIKKNKKTLNEMSQLNSLVLAAKTHIFALEKLNENIISNPEIDLNSALNYVNTKMNLKLSNLENRFQLKESLGDVELLGGWSYKTQQPKPHITAAVPGSLYKFKINQDLDETIIEALAYMEFVGLNHYSELGYNLIYFPMSEEIKKI